MRTVSSGRKLASAAVIFTVGNFAQKGLLFISLPIYARLLSVDDYGRWSLFLGLASIVSIGFDLCWSRAIPRLYYEYWDNEANARAYLFVSFVQRVLLLAVMTPLFLWCSPILVPIISRGALEGKTFSGALAVASIGEALLLYVCAACRARQLAVSFVLLKLFQASAQVCGSLIAFNVLGASSMSIAVGFSLGSLAVAVIATAMFLVWVTSNARGRVSFLSTLQRNSAFSFPLIFHETASWLRNSADPFIIVHFLTLYAVSVYHVGYQFGLLISFLLYSVELAVSPFFFELMKRDAGFRQKYLNMTHFMVGCTFVLVVTVALFSREAIALLFPGEMAEASRIAPVIVSAYFFHGLYTLYVRTFILHGKTAAVPLLTVGPTMAGIAATVLLTPVYGVMAPAYVTVGSCSLLSFVVYLAARRLDDVRHPAGLHVLLGALVLAIGAGASSLWNSPSASTLLAKGIIWLVLMWASYVVFLRGRRVQMRAMVRVDV